MLTKRELKRIRVQPYIEKDYCQNDRISDKKTWRSKVKGSHITINRSHYSYEHYLLLEIFALKEQPVAKIHLNVIIQYNRCAPWTYSIEGMSRSHSYFNSFTQTHNRLRFYVSLHVRSVKTAKNLLCWGECRACSRLRWVSGKKMDFLCVIRWL